LDIVVRQATKYSDVNRVQLFVIYQTFPYICGDFVGVILRVSDLV